ncbi:unnamed protein product [Thlaspi arvense]|uniref:beta-galactosidase n=1 Tax=Thlaspi arvense TaxID=13288 RepID=A0AAU9RCK3_THLAR|nr:unnamed protein product [Thlaspi arvense]
MLCSVTYDKRAIIVNGHRRILLSGSIHYPRSTPEMWEDLIKKAKDGGLDVIDTYVFWNGHEPSPGNYNFKDRYDLVRFIKTVQEVGLYVHLRIGPYYVPGISFRTDNGPFKAAMQGFTQKIVQMMKDHRFFASQGGPIILSQIENEFGPELKGLGPAGHSYVNWAAKMAVGLNTGVPWVMCKEDDAPDPIYHGGTNFGRTAGGPFITTSYDYDAPIDEYGLVQEPKYSHLKQLHQAIKQCESALVSSDPTITKLGNYEKAHVFSAEEQSQLLDCWISVDIKSSESFLRGGKWPTLTVDSAGHAVHVFVNGHFYESSCFIALNDAGSAFGTRESRRFSFSSPVNLRGGANRIALLSIAVGLPNVGPHFETWATGIVGSVAVHGLDEGNKDLSRQKWTYQVGLRGEALNLISPTEASSVDWIKGSLAKQNKQPLTWYKAYFDAPRGKEPLALDLKSMGKGQAWINGQSLGRYWMAFAKGNCGDCNYAGTYRQAKCQSGCGKATQRW